MGICIFTGVEVQLTHSSNTIYYDILAGGRKVTIFICEGCEDRIAKASKPPANIIMGLIANNIWPERSLIIDSKHNNNQDPVDSTRINVDEYFKTIEYPKSYSEKSNYLLQNLLKLQKVDGERLYINLMEDKFWVSNYFKNREECYFYLEGLDKSSLIKLIDIGYGDRAVAFHITHEGLANASVTKDTMSSNSKDCFVAMSFDTNVNKYRGAIKSALKRTGYYPIIIDEENLSSTQTIPDAILSAIKNSKFCIADFTNQSKGVYFESAFAAGLGKKVIYTCEREDFIKNSHFDVKQLQHIIYENEVDLEEQLMKKISSWIN